MNIGNGIGSTSQALSLLSTASTNAAAQTDATKQAAKTNASASQVTADAAKLTSTAGLISLAVSGPDARSNQVQAIQAAIAAGTYNVPASAVADKLIQTLLG